MDREVGEEREDVAAGDVPRAAPAKRLSRGIWVTAALATVVAVWFVVPRSESDPSPTTIDIPPSVAVLPFEVSGEGLDVWREGMVDLLSTNVDVFSEVRAVPSRTVLAKWRETATDGPTDLASALDVARKINARYAIIGSVMGTQNGLRIRGELFDLQTSAKLADAVGEGAPDSIFAVVDQLSVALLSPLLTSRSGNINRPRLASITTTSPTALRALLDGERFFRAADYQPAIVAYKQAVESDSTFALAHFRLSEAYLWAGGAADSREPARLANRYADRLPEREARLVRAGYLATRGRYSALVETLREAVRQHPDDSRAWHMLGEAYFHMGGEVLIRPWEFVDAFERSIALDPMFAPAYEHLLDDAFLREPDSARAAILIEQMARVGEVSARNTAAFGLLFSNPSQRSAAQTRLEDLPSFHLRAMALNTLTHPRFLDVKESVLRTALQRSSPNWERVIKVLLSWTLIARGQVDAAIEVAEDPMLARDRATILYEARTYGYPIPEETLVRALADAPTPSDDPGGAPSIDWTLAAPAIFERGAYATEHEEWPSHTRAKSELRSLIPTIEPENASDTLRVQGLVEALDGYAAWRRGDRERALSLLRNAQVRTTGGHTMGRSIISERNQIVRAWLGQLLLEMNRPREALVYYESLGPGWPVSQDPMIYFHLGRIRDELGDREGAVRAYELAAVAWQDADPEMRPFADTARSEVARLRGLIRQ